MYSYVKSNFKASFFFQLFDLRTPSGGEMDLKIWPRAQGKMGQKSVFEVRFGVLRCLFGGFGG